jgi:hypothetical protein
VEGGVTHAGAERVWSEGSPDVADASCHGHLPASRAHLARRWGPEASRRSRAQRAAGPGHSGGPRPGIGDAATAAGGAERAGSPAAGAWRVPGPAPPHRPGRFVGRRGVPQPTASGPHRTLQAPVRAGRTALRHRPPLRAGSRLSSRSRQRELPPAGAAPWPTAWTPGPALPHPPPPAAGGLPGQRGPRTARPPAGRLRRAAPRPARPATRHRAGASARAGAPRPPHRPSGPRSGGSRGLSPAPGPGSA